MSMHIRAPLQPAQLVLPATGAAAACTPTTLQAVCSLLDTLGCHRQMLWLRMCPCAGPDLLPWGAVGTKVQQQLSAEHAQDPVVPPATAGRAAAPQKFGRELIAQQAESCAAAGSASVPSESGTQRTRKPVWLPRPDLAELLSLPKDAVPCLQSPVRCWQSAAPVSTHKAAPPRTGGKRRLWC